MALYIILAIIFLWCLTPHLILWSLDLPARLKRKASLNFLDASWRGLVMLVPNLIAPIVVPIALLFTKWESEKMPSAFRVWDNDLSMNGDPRKPEGGTWKPVPLDKEGPVYEAVKAGCYWTKGKSHPRSFWARYVWMGFRNRASKGDIMLGKNFSSLPAKTYGDSKTENGHEGWMLVERGSNVRLYMIKKWGSFAYRFNWGFKVEQNRGGKIMPVNISFSLKGWDEK